MAHLTEVRGLDTREAPEVVDVLVESFFDYPVMRFVLGDVGRNYEERLRTLIRFFVMARLLRREWWLGVGSPGDLVGVALVSRPDGRESPPDLAELRQRVWAELGPDAEARYATYTSACGPFPELPHLHLNMIGVRVRSQGQGVARRLMDHVHRMALESPDIAGATLTTEDPANVPIYEHMGYAVTGHAQVVAGLETWSFFRPN